jgi:hypothetical protein
MTPEPAFNLDYTSVEEPEREAIDHSDAIQEIETTKRVGEVIPIRRKEIIEPKAESFDTTEDKPSTLSFKPKRDYILLDIVKGKQPSQEYIMIMRSHFVNPILKSLQLIQPFAGTPDAAPYVANILNNIHSMAQSSPGDPFLEILFALYDSLAFQGQWATYIADQFSNAYGILINFAGRPHLKLDDVEKAIINLENVGFDTTPIPLLIEDDLS